MFKNILALCLVACTVSTSFSMKDNVVAKIRAGSAKVKTTVQENPKTTAAVIAALGAATTVYAKPEYRATIKKYAQLAYNKVFGKSPADDASVPASDASADL